MHFYDIYIYLLNYGSKTELLDVIHLPAMMSSW